MMKSTQNRGEERTVVFSCLGEGLLSEYPEGSCVNKMEHRFSSSFKFHAHWNGKPGAKRGDTLQSRIRQNHHRLTILQTHVGLKETWPLGPFITVTSSFLLWSLNSMCPDGMTSLSLRIVMVRLGGKKLSQLLKTKCLGHYKKFLYFQTKWPTSA